MIVTMTKQETLDWLAKTLGAFGTFAAVWVILYLTANVVDPLGLVSSLAWIAFLSMMVALLANLVVASSLLRWRETASQ